MAFTGILGWILTHKLIVFLSVALFAFFVSTIAVAVEKNNLQDDLATCEILLTSTTTGSTGTTPTTMVPTTNPPNETTAKPNTTEPPTTETPTTTPPKPEVQNYRLPGNANPIQYKIRLHPNLETGTFLGKVNIMIYVESDLKDLIMHNNNLTINNITLSDGINEIKPITHLTANNDTEFFHVHVDQTLTNGTYEMIIDYSGSLDGIVGFYRSVYNGKKIATSKFEPTYARQAFPCFDEPAMKANYIVELVRPNDYIALSNMNEVNATKFDDENMLVEFAESVKMSTYLACFIVCDFDYKEVNITAPGSPVFKFRVYATKDQINKTDFSLDFGKQVTEYYIDYFKIDYPLPKLDMIAIPDFVSGAMEHWGLVTYRETNLLFDEKSSTSNKQSIARVVAHEISHMWFGNLVTMKWWNDLWLNEGFASYMQYKACAHIFKDWEYLDQFLIANSHSIYALDGTLNSHPIVQTVETPDEITAIFDSITYNKGAAVIRMLEDFVGEENFKTGVTNYLNKHKYGNTVTQDLLNELEEVFDSSNGKNVTYIMDTWTKQMGLPVVYVKQESDTTFKLTQKRFLANPDVKTDSDINYKWQIPIRYKVRGETGTHLIWFPDTSDSIEIKLNGTQRLLKVNLDQIGYYRVNYDDSLWTELRNDLKNMSTTELSISDRAHLLNDIFNLAEASEVPYEAALEFSKYLTEETHYVPWSVGSSVFSTMKAIMSNSEAYIEFRAFVKELLMKIFNIVEQNEEPTHVQKLLQSTVYDLACSMGMDECLKMVEEKFKAFLGGEEVTPDLKSTVYYYGVSKTSEKEWLQLWARFLNESDAIEKTKFMSALAGSNDPSILKRYLNLAWDEDNIRSQDHLSVIQYISSNPIGAPLVWDHVRENWVRLVNKFTLNSRTLGTTIPAITRNFATALKLEEMEDFFKKYPEAGAGATARKQALERVKNNIKWLEKHEPAVKAWLNKQN